MRVKELLKERGMTAKELAARLGMTETGLSIAIGDNGNPPLKRLQEIADIWVLKCRNFSPLRKREQSRARIAGSR